jgi:hypothetical protein
MKAHFKIYFIIDLIVSSSGILYSQTTIFVSTVGKDTNQGTHE